jgi:hypothetical protein
VAVLIDFDNVVVGPVPDSQRLSAFLDRLDRLDQEGGAIARDLLSAAQLPDATARNACALIERTPKRVEAILRGLVELTISEWRPTYIQLNCGTLVPFLLDGIEPQDRFKVDARMVYSSLVFEHTRLRRTDLVGGTFLNASFDGADWQDVKFVDCELGESTFSRQARYSNVVVRDSRIEGVRVIDGPEEFREYAPERISLVLSSLGVIVDHAGTAEEVPGNGLTDGDTRRLTKRLLNLFRRTTILPEVVLKKRFPRDASAVFDLVVPLMVKHGVLDERAWHGSGVQKAWGLGNYRLEDIERADGDTSHQLAIFWREVDAIDRRADGSKHSKR